MGTCFRSRVTKMTKQSRESAVGEVWHREGSQGKGTLRKSMCVPGGCRIPECLSLCSRVLVLSGGERTWAGSVADLRNTFFMGMVVTVTMSSEQKPDAMVVFLRRVYDIFGGEAQMVSKQKVPTPHSATTHRSVLEPRALTVTTPAPAAHFGYNHPFPLHHRPYMHALRRSSLLMLIALDEPRVYVTVDDKAEAVVLGGDIV